MEAGFWDLVNWILRFFGSLEASGRSIALNFQAER